MAQKLIHPSTAELSDFTLGRLSSDEASAVEEHISECDTCCETLLQLSAEDTFVDLLKQAKNTPASATLDLECTTPSDSAMHTGNIPAELANHPRYHVNCLIGRGGMGDVYQAEHRLMRRPVALKIINRQLVNKPEAVERFHREVRAAARLNHPNIVTAYDAEQAQDTHFLAMEYVEGTELSEIVKRDGRLPVEVACEYARQVALGLSHAHEMGMVHRDVKPQNMMVTPAGDIKILDFGLANFACESVQEDSIDSEYDASGQATRVIKHLTQLGTMMGTPDYIAPEQAKDARRADIRSDIYSLGCTLFYLLTGRPPFEGDSALEKIDAHSKRLPESLTALREEIPVALQDVVAKMMAKNPDHRYQTPADVVAALQEVGDQLQRDAKSDRSGRGIHGSRRFWLMAAGAFGMAVIALITDRGRLEIQSEVDDVKVIVTQDGEEARIVDLSTGSQVTWLPTGEYELRLLGNDNKVVLDQDGFKMSRLGKVIVTARTKDDPNTNKFTSSEVGQEREVSSGPWLLPENEVGTEILSKAAVDLSTRQFEFHNAAMLEKGYRPIDVNTYLVDRTVRICAVWVPFGEPRPDIKVYVDLAETKIQMIFDQMTESEYRLTRITGHVADSSPQYNLIFERERGLPYLAKPAMQKDRFQNFFDQKFAEGFRMTDLCIFHLGNELHPASIWEKDTSHKWQARLGLGTSAFNRLAANLSRDGYVPHRISPYLAGREPHYASIWLADRSQKRKMEVGMTKDALQRRTKELRKEGFRLIQLAPLSLRNRLQYAAIWEKVDPKHSESAAATELRRVAVLTRDGRYWHSRADEEKLLLRDSNNNEPTTLFELEWKDPDDPKDNRVWFKTPQGTYVRGIPDRDGNIETTSDQGFSELFSVEWVDRNKLKLRLKTRDGEYLRASVTRGPHLDTTAVPRTSEVFTLVPSRD